MDREILTVLDTYERLSLVEIADVIDAHPLTVDRHCYQLLQKGYIKMLGSGIYVLTEKGKEDVEKFRTRRTDQPP